MLAIHPSTMSIAVGTPTLESTASHVFRSLFGRTAESKLCPLYSLDNTYIAPESGIQAEGLGMSYPEQAFALL